MSRFVKYCNNENKAARNLLRGSGPGISVPWERSSQTVTKASSANHSITFCVQVNFFYREIDRAQSIGRNSAIEFQIHLEPSVEQKLCGNRKHFIPESRWKSSRLKFPVHPEICKCDLREINVLNRSRNHCANDRDSAKFVNQPRTSVPACPVTLQGKINRPQIVWFDLLRKHNRRRRSIGRHHGNLFKRSHARLFFFLFRQQCQGKRHLRRNVVLVLHKSEIGRILVARIDNGNHRGIESARK